MYFTYYISGNDINTKTQEHLKKAYEVMEINLEENGRLLLRSLFKSDPDLMPHYPFFKDEWNKISYADYAGTHPDQPVNTWFVVCRCETVSAFSKFFLDLMRLYSQTQFFCRRSDSNLPIIFCLVQYFYVATC